MKTIKDFKEGDLYLDTQKGREVYIKSTNYGNLEVRYKAGSPQDYKNSYTANVDDLKFIASAKDIIYFQTYLH